METVADVSFGLNGSVMAVLALLSRRRPDTAPYVHEERCYNYTARTFLLYRGGEPCVGLQVKKAMGAMDEPTLVLVWGEDRFRGSLTLDSWEMTEGENPPTLSDAPATLLETREHFELTGGIAKLADEVMSRIGSFLYRD